MTTKSKDNLVFRSATKEDIKTFMSKAIMDEELYPYMAVTKYMGTYKEHEDDWNGITFVDDKISILGSITINRTEDNGFDVSLYSTTPVNKFRIGKALLFIETLIKRYDPMYIETIVHASNKRSMKINERIFGKAWGVKPKGAWNMATGEWEDLYHFRKILKQ